MNGFHNPILRIVKSKRGSKGISSKVVDYSRLGSVRRSEIPSDIKRLGALGRPEQRDMKFEMLERLSGKQYYPHTMLGAQMLLDDCLLRGGYIEILGEQGYDIILHTGIYTSKGHYPIFAVFEACLRNGHYFKGFFPDGYKALCKYIALPRYRCDLEAN